MERHRAEDYTYRVSWSEDDGMFVCTADEFKSLSNLDGSRHGAFAGMVDLLQSVLDDIYGEGGEPPAPFSERRCPGMPSPGATDSTDGPSCARASIPGGGEGDGAMGRYLYEAVLYPAGGKVEVRVPDLGLVTFGDGFADAASMAGDLLELDISERLSRREDVPGVGRFGHACPEGGVLVELAVDAAPGSADVPTMTIREAADLLGVPCASVRAMVKDGTLRAVGAAGHQLVLTDDVREVFNGSPSPDA